MAADLRPAAVAETHTGVVFFLGDRAYKVKKPVRFEFLDFSTHEARETACRREVELNRRLAPDVYLGVADVVGPDGAVCDHMVVMRRMPDERRLSARVTAGEAVEEPLHDVARQVAVLHAGAPTAPDPLGVAGRTALAGRWDESIDTLRRFEGNVVDAAVVDHVAELARRYLEGRAALFDDRIRTGRVRDGHGDLLADDVFCLDDGPRILDCLEFDDRLRCGDVLADVAFLAMDLERLGRTDLGERFLRDYRALSGEEWPASLAHHYVAYRAAVRTKVACLRSEQGDAAAADQARHLLDIACRRLEAGRVRLVLVGGLPGTGKSTLAAALGDVVGAVVLRSDEVRNELTGGVGVYDEATTTRTYVTVLDRARALLGLGESVVLDATWHDPRWRAAAADTATDGVAELVELECRAPVEVMASRIATRQAAGTDVSDATVEVATAMAVDALRWPTAATIDTSGAPEASLARALDVVEAR